MNSNYDFYLCREKKKVVKMGDIKWIGQGWQYGHAGSTPYMAFCKKAKELGFHVPADFEKTYDLYMEQAVESALLNIHKQQKKPSPSSAINSYSPLGEPIYYRSWLEHKKQLDAMREKSAKLNAEKKNTSIFGSALTSTMDFLNFKKKPQ